MLLLTRIKDMCSHYPINSEIWYDTIMEQFSILLHFQTWSLFIYKKDLVFFVDSSDTGWKKTHTNPY